MDWEEYEKALSEAEGDEFIQILDEMKRIEQEDLKKQYLMAEFSDETLARVNHCSVSYIGTDVSALQWNILLEKYGKEGYLILKPELVPSSCCDGWNIPQYKIEVQCIDGSGELNICWFVQMIPEISLCEFINATTRHIDFYKHCQLGIRL